MKRLSLNGRYALTRPRTNDKPIQALVPGVVHLDLRRAKKISDPYYRDNERHLGWVGDTTWVYERTFSLTEEQLSCPKILLIFRGLDTLASVYLNDKLVLTADNMHRTWEVDATGELEAGSNKLRVHLHPVLPYLENKDKIEPRTYGWADFRAHNAGWIRKQPCNFGWDWGPILLTAGIWRDVELAFIDKARIAGFECRQQHQKGQVKLALSVTAERASKVNLRLRARLALDGRRLASADVDCQRNTAALELLVKAPKLWWPNGLGGQPLYHLTLELVDQHGNVVDQQEKRVGLRTLTLRRRRDRFGQSFEFLANGVPFFAKGANWVPADTFAPSVTRDDYAKLIGAARQANMNMLRVWGGNVYEDDAFYDLCDDHGICVWQDFMFACGTYPAFDQGFLENVRREAVDNVRRLRHHACLALFCGNNEIEQAFVSDEWTERTMGRRDYEKLFKTLLGGVVKTEAPDISYWQASPHTPEKSRDVHDDRSGDAHLWGVWHGREPFEWYRKCQHRFISEFGYQSFPEPRTVKTFTEPEDRNITSFVMEQHQRSPIGNSVIIGQMGEWFLLPKDFDSTLWLSQIQQGVAMKIACEHWRRNMPRTMGTLFWQFNDCWPAASWSAIDSLGRKKALFFMARHFFAPLLLSAVEDAATGKLDVFVSNDTTTKSTGRFRWLVTTANGKALGRGSQACEVAAGTSKRIARLSLGGLLAEYSTRDLLVWLKLHSGGKMVSRNLASFARPKHLLLTDPGLKVSVKAKADRFVVTIRATRPALFVWLQLEKYDAQFSDNFSSIAGGDSLEVQVTPDRKLSLSAFKRALQVKHLGSTHL